MIEFNHTAIGFKLIMEFILITSGCTMISDENMDNRGLRNESKVKNCSFIPYDVIEDAQSVLGPLDKFKCLEGLNEESISQFSNFQMFKEYITPLSYNAIDETSINTEGYVISRFIIEHHNQVHIKILVSQKIFDEDVNQNYSLKTVKSIMNESDFEGQWTPLSYQWEISNNLVIIDYCGRMEYLVQISGFDFRISDYRKFKLIIDQLTGLPLDIIEIDQ